MVQGHYDLITFSGYSAGQRGREEEEEERGRKVHSENKISSAAASLKDAFKDLKYTLGFKFV